MKCKLVVVAVGLVGGGLLVGLIVWNRQTGNLAYLPANDGPKAAAQEPQSDKGKPPDKALSFPGDIGGKKVAQLPVPAAKLPPPGSKDRHGPRTFPVPASLEVPQTPLPPARLEAVRGPVKPTPQVVSPRPLLSNPGLARSWTDPVLPPHPELPVGLRLRLPSPDVDQPPPLPVLARNQPDRIPLDDPTGDASVEAALAAQLPARTAPAPFLPLNLPDPFENSLTVRLRTPPLENPTPMAGGPRLPGR